MAFDIEPNGLSGFGPYYWHDHCERCGQGFQSIERHETACFDCQVIRALRLGEDMKPRDLTGRAYWLYDHRCYRKVCYDPDLCLEGCKKKE